MDIFVHYGHMCNFFTVTFSLSSLSQGLLVTLEAVTEVSPFSIHIMISLDLNAGVYVQYPDLSWPPKPIIYVSLSQETGG